MTSEQIGATDPIRHDFAGRVALVTGASRGIGAAVAEALGRAGAQVVAVARTVGGLEELDDRIRKAGGPGALLVPHDLRDQDGLDRLGASLYERYGRLDCLVAAAAQLGVLSPCGHIEPKVWNDVLAVNLTANHRLLRSLDPLLRRATAGRVVVLGDRVAERTPAYWAAYAASKAGLETVALCYAAEVERSEIRCNIWRPGPTRTALRAQAFPGEDPISLPSPEGCTDGILSLLSPDCLVNGEVLGPEYKS